MTDKNRESRAVIAALQGGGMVMFSCTADGADAAETYLDEARAKRRVVDIQDIVNAISEMENRREMTIGTGIAMVAIWGFAAACALSRRVTGTGLVISVVAAVIATAILRPC